MVFAFIHNWLIIKFKCDTLILDVSEKNDHVYCERYGMIYSFGAKTTPWAYTIHTSKDSALYNGVLVTIEKTAHSDSSYRIKTDYLTLIDGNPIAATGNTEVHEAANIRISYTPLIFNISLGKSIQF